MNGHFRTEKIMALLTRQSSKYKPRKEETFEVENFQATNHLKTKVDDEILLVLETPGYESTKTTSKVERSLLINRLQITQ